MRLALPLFFALLAAACSDAPVPPQNPHATPPAGVEPCTSSADCAEEEWCLHDRCVRRAGPATADPELVAHVTVAPATLGFGSVTPPGRRRLGVVVQNDGEAMVTVRSVRVLPEGTAFEVAPLGYGPFWIRPGRSRDLFVTFAPGDAAHQSATLVIESEAPEVTVQLGGN